MTCSTSTTGRSLKAQVPQYNPVVKISHDTDNSGRFSVFNVNGHLKEGIGGEYSLSLCVLFHSNR